MIKRFRVQNFKALRDVSLELTPIHVLIGPNDTGKTSIMEALAALCRSVDHKLPQAFTGRWDGLTLVWQRDANLDTTLAVDVTHGHGVFDYELVCRFPPTGTAVTVWREVVNIADGRPPFNFGLKDKEFSGVYRLTHLGRGEKQLDEAAAVVHDALFGVQYYRWIPRLLSLPVAPDSKVRYRLEESGFGMARFLDDILGHDRKRFDELERRFVEIFPEVKSIRLIQERGFRTKPGKHDQVDMFQEAEGKGVYLKFRAFETELPASQVSDGLMIVLAYLAVLYSPKPPRLLLVEEPENGIHPKRLGDVLGVLRKLVSEQSHVQVILSTHSPYVIDHFEPEEVTLCRRNKDGSIAVQRLSESKAVQEQRDVFTLGEIWTGEGDDALAESSGSHEDSDS